MMKNNTMILKLIVSMVLILAIIASISNIVFADNETADINALFGNGTNTSNNTTNNTTNDTNEFENALEKNVVNKNATINNTNNSTNNTTNKLNTLNSSNKATTNSLAKTGIGDTNSIVTLIIVVSGIIAVYSYKKLNDYKKL